jgi:hypothetical protein
LLLDVPLRFFQEFHEEQSLDTGLFWALQRANCGTMACSRLASGFNP